MILSINPSYYCNFRCDFCYLTEQQLSDRKMLPLDILEKRIVEVLQYDAIDMVDLYGGEIGVLPEKYVKDMCSILHKHGIDDINIITNLSMVNDIIRDPSFYVTVSYDFDCREQHERVWNNMFMLPKVFSILILASKKLLDKNIDDMISQLNLLGNLSSVEIKPYSTNQANAHDISHADFEKFVQGWIESPVVKKFQFINEENIIKSIKGTRNAFSNDHVYITPEGKFAVLEFDLNDNEYFKSLDSFQGYMAWASNEPRLNVSQICRDCKYYGTCLTEHYRYVKDLNNSCNGYVGLLNWYNKKESKMFEWKVRQEIYHRLTKHHEDDAENFDIVISEDVVENAIKYFKTKDIGWIWPAKSYMVGICYARWLAEDYGGNPLEYLKDPALLYNNDPYFKPYNQDPTTYLKILENIGSWTFDVNTGVVPEVRKYYDLEFGETEWNME